MVAGCYLVDVSVCYLAASPTSSQTLMGNFKTFNHTDRWDATLMMEFQSRICSTILSLCSHRSCSIHVVHIETLARCDVVRKGFAPARPHTCLFRHWIFDMNNPGGRGGRDFERRALCCIDRLNRPLGSGRDRSSRHGGNDRLGQVRPPAQKLADVCKDSQKAVLLLEATFSSMYTCSARG